jgi:hypothetical protein
MDNGFNIIFFYSDFNIIESCIHTVNISEKMLYFKGIRINKKITKDITKHKKKLKKIEASNVH